MKIRKSAVTPWTLVLLGMVIVSGCGPVAVETPVPTPDIAATAVALQPTSDVAATVEVSVATALASQPTPDVAATVEAAVATKMAATQIAQAEPTATPTPVPLTATPEPINTPTVGPTATPTPTDTPIPISPPCWEDDFNDNNVSDWRRSDERGQFDANIVADGNGTATVYFEDVPPPTDPPWGKFLSPIMMLNVGSCSRLRVVVTQVSGGRFKIGVQEEEDNWSYYGDLIIGNQPGTYEADIASATGWTEPQPHTFSIEIVVEGSIAQAIFDSIEIVSP